MNDTLKTIGFGVFISVIAGTGIWFIMTCALPPSPSAVVLSETRPGSGQTFLRTIRHDDHLWVTNGAGSTAVHHPDCPCAKGERP